VSKAQRIKGARVECEIVNSHRHIGVHAERYPLSDASRFRGLGHDIDLYVLGSEQAPLVAEVKARRKITRRAPSR
jgi:Holliday junction resolvase